MMTNIGQLLQQRARVSPALEAYVEADRGLRLDFTELDRLSNRCAGLLDGLGLRRGERLALLLPNSAEFIGLFTAAAKLGIVTVPLNTRLTASELSFILSDSGARMLVYGDAFDKTVEAIRAQTDHPLSLDHCLSATQLTAELAQSTELLPALGSGDDDNLFIMYTSGTTGLPKGVVHTHSSIFCSATSWSATIEVRYADRILMPLPMFHVAALTSVVFCILRGITIISMPQFDPLRAWSLIIDEKVTIGAGVPAILNFMRQVPGFAELEAPDFRFFITGGAALPASLTQLYNEKGIQAIQGYALTESGGGGSLLLNEDALRKIGSAGKAGMLVEIGVRDDDGAISFSGEGEIVIRAGFMMKEYWNRPEATAEAFQDGWFRTGDVAEIDDEGFIFIKDRIKDMIISGGENIYPAEIENVLLSHPGIREAAVIGLPDEKWGEIVCAVVVADPAEVSEEAVVAHCGAKLSRYKLPRKVLFEQELPRNASGKVLKRVLRERIG